jgi:uncharacterized membrane protein YgaE (UPF0421/DUF939 family)
MKGEIEMDELNARLDELILSKIEEINLGQSENESDSVNDLVKLYKARADQEKDTNDFDAKIREIEVRETEVDLKGKELENATAHCEEDRKIHLGLEIANTAIPVLLYSFWLVKGFKFEETGVLRSSTFKSITSKMRPFKKWW